MITKLEVLKLDENKVNSEKCEDEKTEFVLNKPSKSISYNLYTSEKDVQDIDSFYKTESYSPKRIIKKSGKKVGLFFSGGYDSTCLLIKNLEEGNEVYPIEVIFSRNETFLKRITLYQLRKIYGTELLHDLIDITDYQNTSMYFETKGISQQPVCAFSAAFIPSDIMFEISEIQLGYVMCDYAISFLDEIVKLYKTALVFKCYSKEDKLPEITFPLTKTVHEDTIKYVLDWSNENKIVLPCTSCEVLDVKARKVNKYSYEYKITECHACHKCKTQDHSSSYILKVTFKG